jgi:hypothetical protein
MQRAISLASARLERFILAGLSTESIFAAAKLQESREKNEN